MFLNHLGDYVRIGTVIHGYSSQSRPQVIYYSRAAVIDMGILLPAHQR